MQTEERFLVVPCSTWWWWWWWCETDVWLWLLTSGLDIRWVPLLNGSVLVWGLFPSICNWSTSCLSSIIWPRIVSIAPLLQWIVATSAGSINGIVVCCSRLTVDNVGFSLLFCSLVNLFIALDSRFLACTLVFDALNILYRASYKTKVLIFINVFFLLSFCFRI